MDHDPAERRKNLRKPGIDLPACMQAFEHPMLSREDDREDGPRLISCREAQSHERQAYFRAYPQG